MKYNYVTNTKNLFENLNISSNYLKKSQKQKLKKQGYLIFENSKFLKQNLGKLRKAVDTIKKKEGINGGWEGKEKYYKKGKLFERGAFRYGNLIEKNKIFAELITIPEILASAREVVQDELKICGLNYREPLKNDGFQKIHVDWKPRKNKKEKFAGIVCMIYLDKTSKKNGSTRIIPGSHKKLGWPSKHIDINKINNKEIRPSIKAGGIMILNLNLWHAGSKNFKGLKRRTIMINIKSREFPQLLNYKKYLSKKTINKLNGEQKYLLAVRDNDKKQKENSVGVGKYYKKNFHFSKNLNH